MALIHRAELNPSKLEMLQRWVPVQSWAVGVDTSSLEIVGAYRFDDPDGEVGLEAHLVECADGQVLHVPVSYRGAPLEGADSAFVTTMDHSVLGERWVYDGTVDPVFLRAFASTIVSGGQQASMDVETETGTAPRELTTFVVGSGGGGAQPVVVRIAGSVDVPEGAATLTGTWPGQQDPVVLAYLEA
ncbi:CG0192-related protein [Actinomycetes bacterium M1A6_2h]